MPQHEIKKCPHCSNNFECKVGNVLECQCNGIQLTYEERKSIEENNYLDCLCIDCLHVLRYEYQMNKKKIKTP